MTGLFKGLSAFPLTPVDAQGVVQTDRLGTYLERLVDAGVHSVGLLGSTGIYAYLEPVERIRAVAAAAEVIKGRVPLIVGVGALRTDWSQNYARNAEKAGADGLLMAPVSYTPLQPEEVYAHYNNVLSVTGLPLCVYNNPSTTHFTFSHGLLVRLSALDGVAAIKMPLPADGDFASEIATMRQNCKTGFSIGYSGDWGAAAALLAGADSWSSVIAGLLPAQALKLTLLSMEGQHDEAEALNRAFEPFWSLFRQFGSLRIMYGIADCLGIGAGSPPLPLQRSAPDVDRRIEQAVQALMQA